MLSNMKTLLKAPRELSMVLSCEYLDSFATFSLDYVFVLLLSQQFGFDDVWAGWIYGFYGVSVMLLGLLLGPLIDNIGVKWTLVLGSFISLGSRVSVVFVADPNILLLILLLILPTGVALTSNVLKLGIRRYTNAQNRSLAFDCSYMTINSAALFSAFLLTTTRTFAAPYGSYFRIYLFFAAAGCVLQVLMALFMREIVVDEATGELMDFKINQASPSQIIQDVASSPDLWRFVAVSFALCLGAGTILRHFGSTFPKTYTRFNGINAPYELVLGLNPMIILCVLPLFSYVRLATKLSLYDSIMIGSLISAIAMFIMGFSLGVVTAIVGLCVFTMGEIMWAPRFMEWSVMVGREGREGTVIALTGFPKFIARLFAGGTSGWLLSNFCPAAGECSNGTIVWILIGLLSMSTPVCMMLLKKVLWKTDDLQFKKGAEDADIMDAASSESIDDAEGAKGPLLESGPRFSLGPSSLFS